MDESGNFSTPGSNIKIVTTELLIKEFEEHLDAVSKTTDQPNAESSVKNDENTNVFSRIPVPEQFGPGGKQTISLFTTPDGGQLYLIGTINYCVPSLYQVSQVIKAVQPDIIVVQLCESRFKKLLYGNQFSTKRFLPFRFNVNAEDRQVPMGCEFRIIFQEARRIPDCTIHLGDRPSEITTKRVLRSLSWWQAVKFYLPMAFKINIGEKEKECSVLHSMLNNTAAKIRRMPVWGNIFLEEGNLYLAYSLQNACLPRNTSNGIVPTRVVGVVGLLNTPGIIANLGKVKPSDIERIMKVPPLSLYSKILRFAIIAPFVGATTYVGYKLIKVSIIILRSITSLLIRGF